jgi:ABC-type glycerol-3-phosphate transport system substrate-binding protein
LVGTHVFFHRPLEDQDSEEKEMSSKKMSRREFLKLAGIGMGGVVLASCAPQATEAPVVPQAPAATEAPTKAPPEAPVTGKLVVMHKVQEGELTADMVTQFQDKYPGITVDTVQDDLTLFFSMYAAGNPPDLVRIQAPSVPPYLARGMLYDLTPYFEASALLRPDDLAPANN